MLNRILIAGASEPLAKRLHQLLAAPDRHVETLETPPQPDSPDQNHWALLTRSSADLFLVDHSLLPDPTVETIRMLNALPEQPDVIVLWDTREADMAAEAMAAGASANLYFDSEDLILKGTCLAVIERRVQRFTPRSEESPLPPRLVDFETNSPRMKAFLSVVRRIIHSDSTLLVTGETGVGKEHLARAIHGESHRSGGPFVSVNCGALPESLLESELFGHEEGAFTGAVRSRRGMFELSHNGTIFLDEIGEMPSHLQVKLLQVLQTREFRRIGGDRSIAVNVRVIAATHRDLAAEIEQKTFRVDLYYRLSVVSLEIPPLRDRQEDIERLVSHFVVHYQHRFASRVESVSTTALAALSCYAWPGNIRELGNIVERAMLLATHAQITLDDLPTSISKRGMAGTATTSAEDWGATSKRSLQEAAFVEAPLAERPLAEVRQAAIESVERQYLDQLLRRTEGRIGETATRAGIPTRSLYTKMRQYGLAKEHYRPRRSVGS